MPNKPSTALPAPLPRCPLVPDQVLKDHNVFFEIDTRFRKAARLLQALWLKDRSIEPGVHVRGEGADAVIMPLHSNLSAAAAAKGLNFLSPETLAFVQHELLMQEDGAAYDVERLLKNSLSSQPMTFNVFAPLAMDLNLATKVFKNLLPEYVHAVHEVKFEHSPGRRISGVALEDGTAVDAAIKVTDVHGRPGTIFVETKYSEDMAGPAARLRERYDEISRASGLFVDPDSPMLRTLALEQLWREHMVCQWVSSKTGESAVFLAIGPRLNRRVMAAFRCYQAELIQDHHEDDNRVPFVPLTLEELFTAIDLAGAKDLAKDLHARYTDFERIYHLCLDTFVPKPIEKASNKRLPRKSTEVRQPVAASSSGV